MTEKQGFFQRLFNSEPIEQRKASPFVLPPSRDVLTDVTIDAALGVASVFRAVNILTTGISQLTLDTYRAGEQIPNATIINQPDVNRSRSSFLKRTTASLALNGNAYWKLTKSNSGVVNNLEVLNPLEVTVAYSDSGVKSYKHGNKTYRDSQVKHLRYTEVPGHIYGVGPIQAYKNGIRGTIGLRDYSDNWLKNSGVPTGLLKTDMQLEPELANATKEAWHQSLEGGGIAVLGNGMDFTPLLLNAADIQFIESSQLSDKQIARIFGIPDAYLMVDTGGTSLTYTNRQDLETTFIRWTLMQYILEIEDALSEVLPRGQDVKFNIQAFLRSDDKSRYEAYKTAIEAGFMSPEYVAEVEGLPKLTPQQPQEQQSQPKEVPTTAVQENEDGN